MYLLTLVLRFLAWLLHRSPKNPALKARVEKRQGTAGLLLRYLSYVTIICVYIRQIIGFLSYGNLSYVL